MSLKKEKTLNKVKRGHRVIFNTECLLCIVVIYNDFNIKYFVFTDYILYAFAVALFVGTLILLPLAVVINIW